MMEILGYRPPSCSTLSRTWEDFLVHIFFSPQGNLTKYYLPSEYSMRLLNGSGILRDVTSA